MFNSQKINNDPEPYVGWSGKRYDEETRTFASLEDGPVGVEPRPEFDNNPNQILVEFRGDLKTKQPYWSEVDIIKRWQGVNGLSTKTGEYPAYKGIWSLMDAYPEYVDHARKVLTRLVNIFGTEED